MPAGRQRPGPVPVTVPLDPSRPVQVASGDQALELDVPAGAVSAVDVSAAGGSMSLLVRQVVPASGGSGGGSGVVTFGTFLVQVLDAKGHLARQGLRQPLGVKLHVPGRAGALDLGHAVAVVNAPLPPGVSLDPAATPQLAGPASSPASATTGGTASSTTSPNHGLGRMTRTPATVDPTAGTLSTSAAATNSSTTVSFASVAPVATFGAPDLAEVSLNAGGLRLQDPLDLPAGPGGLTPSLKLSYDSAVVSDQHDVAAAAPWVGEGWHLSLGGISWAERNITQGCSTVCAGFDWGDTWLLVDSFGTKAELIPPNDVTSTYYEDFNGT
ncbi:MAG TPA: hypothetical protein VLW53_17230, partial [Candidatus Eisenbacteria bacterium]|nr:hypothetical protein [Candidatus Eisenbacteria bacterium]